MKFAEYAPHLNKIPPFTLSIGLILFAIMYRKLNSMHKAIGIYIILMLLVDLASRVLGSYGNNLILIPIYALIELIFFVHFYNKYILIKPNKTLIALGIVGMLYIIGEILEYFVLNTLNVKQFQPYAKIVDNFIIVIMALVFYYQKMNSFNETKWTNFKINTVLLIFFTINAIMFLPFNFIVNDSSGVKFYIWAVNVIIIILFYIYLSVSIWKNSRRAIVKS